MLVACEPHSLPFSLLFKIKVVVFTADVCMFTHDYPHIEIIIYIPIYISAVKFTVLCQQIGSQCVLIIESFIVNKTREHKLYPFVTKAGMIVPIT